MPTVVSNEQVKGVLSRVLLGLSTQENGNKMQKAVYVTYLVLIDWVGRRFVTQADQVQICIDDRHQQRILGMLKNLIPKLGRGTELVRGHRHSLHEEHFVNVFVLDVNLVAVGHILVFHSIQQGQDVGVSLPHTFEHLTYFCRCHVAWSAATAESHRFVSCACMLTAWCAKILMHDALTA